MTELPRVLAKGRRFKDALASGRRLSGAWSTLGSVEVTVLMARAGLDFVLIDLEHGMGGIDGLTRQVQALLSLDTAVMVRLPDHENGSIKRILDAGANALLVPQVDTAAQAKSVIASAMFAPDGQRGVAVGAIAAADNGYAPDTYFKNANDALTILTQVESPQAVENVLDVLAIPHLDGIFVGPNDLSATMGKFRDYDDAAFQAAFETVLTQTLAAGKLFGALPFPGNDADTLAAKGARVVPNGSDQGFLRAGALQLVNEATNS